MNDFLLFLKYVHVFIKVFSSKIARQAQIIIGYRSFDLLTHKIISISKNEYLMVIN